MRNQDLILLDTAGRSPKDDIKIRELKAFLTEASADEVHLVLSAVASARTLEQTAQRFAAVGTTRLLVTKLDEASSLGSLLPLVRSCKLPLSYLTNGQNVPDDIETAEPGRAARLVLAMEASTRNEGHGMNDRRPPGNTPVVPANTPRREGEQPHLCEAPSGPFRQMDCPLFPEANTPGPRRCGSRVRKNNSTRQPNPSITGPTVGSLPTVKLEYMEQVYRHDRESCGTHLRGNPRALGLCDLSGAGWIHAWGTETTLLRAWIGLWAFAALGAVLGWLAEPDHRGGSPNAD